MLCSKCGMQNNETNKLCSYCGTALQSLQQLEVPQVDDFQTMNNSYNRENYNTNSQSVSDNSNANNIYKLTLTRPKAFEGSLWNLKIYIDGEKKSVLKNGGNITLTIKGGNHHISVSGYSDYTLQILSDASANVVITNTKRIMLENLVGMNIIEDENSPYITKSTNIANLVMISSILLLLPSLIFSQFMTSIVILLIIIITDIALAIIGMLLTRKQKTKLGYSFKKVMISYIGAIIINIISIIVCLIIKGF